MAPVSTYDLHDRTAVVTGASGAIGSAIVRTLVASGVRTALLARTKRRLEKLQRRLPDTAPTLVCPTDVTSAFDIVEAREKIHDVFGPVDLVVAAAGVRRAAPFEEAIPADWNAMEATNVRGVLQTVQIFSSDAMAAAARGQRADIVLLSTSPARERQKAYSVFSSFGASIRQFSKHLRAEYGPRGVRVHHIASLFTAGSFFAASNIGSDRSTSLHHDILPADMGEVNTVDTERIADEVGFMTSLPAHVNMAAASILPLRNR